MKLWACEGNVVESRKKVLQVAFEAHPERFVRGVPTPPALPEAAWINPPPEAGTEGKLLQ
jgi:putative transposase